MYDKILVPLDGSELAECVIPHVQALAQSRPDAEVTLLYVVEPLEVPGSSPEFKKKIETEGTTAAREYLQDISKQLAGIKRVSTEVILGKPADTIASYADKIKADIVVMATHGRTGVRRWFLGSVADKVLHCSVVPVVLIRVL